MNYYNICLIMIILLILSIILIIYNKLNTNIENLENKHTKKCESLGIEIDSNLECPDPLSKYNMTNNNVIDFYNAPGEYSEVNKLFIWRKLSSCCIVDFVIDGNLIYGVGTNGKIYIIKKSGGLRWTGHIRSGWVSKIIIVGDYIYGLGGRNSSWRHKKNGSGNWERVGQEGWQTLNLISDNNNLYGIGIDYRINYIPLSGGNWKNYSPGYIYNMILFKNKIYAIGMNNNIYSYPLIPPPVVNNPVCEIKNLNNNWKRCAFENQRCEFKGIADVIYKRADGREPNRNKIKRVSNGIDCNNRTFGDPAYGHRKACFYKNIPIIDIMCDDKVINNFPSDMKNTQDSLSKCRNETSKGVFGKCPIVHKEKWQRVSNCCVTDIAGHGEYLYGRGTNGKIYRLSLNKKGIDDWHIYIQEGWVKNIVIDNNNIYGIGSNKALYVHPIKEEKIEGFCNSNSSSSLIRDITCD